MGPLATSSLPSSPMIQNTLKNWSFKKYKMWLQCPLAVKLKYIERAPEPEPNAKDDAARLRGIQMHNEMEACIKGEGPIPGYAKEFEGVIAGLIDQGARAEEDMFFNERWELHPGWDGHWLQVKQDILVVNDEYILNGDWKSGRRFGNEFWHFKQMQLYSVATWRAFPGRPEYTAELYYLDKDDIWTVQFTPQQLEKAFADFDRDVDKMFNDTVFRPKPSEDTCRFCPFNRKKGTGVCPVSAV